MTDEWLRERLRGWGNRPAVIWRDEETTYAELLAATDAWHRELDAAAVAAGEVVALEGDYSPRACTLLLALIERAAVAVPLSGVTAAERAEFLDIAGCRRSSQANGEPQRIERRAVSVAHPLTRALIERAEPGLVLFSSGATGKNKAALHDFARLLEKFQRPRPAFHTLSFLLLDHIGGINTLLHTLANGGAVVTVATRDPDTVCAAIARAQGTAASDLADVPEPAARFRGLSSATTSPPSSS